jgi:hypothetical protein
MPTINKREATIDFKGAEFLTVADLTSFLFSLDYAYECVYLFYNIDSRDDINVVLESLINRRRVPVRINYAYNIRSRSNDATDVLRIHKINMNSPGDFSFLGDMNPLTNLKDIYVERNRHKEWEKEFKHRKKIENQKMAIDKTEAQQKKEEAELEYEIAKIRAQQEIEFRNLEIVQKRIETYKMMGYSSEEIKRLIDYTITHPVDNLIDNSPKFRLKGRD